MHCFTLCIRTDIGANDGGEDGGCHRCAITGLGNIPQKFPVVTDERLASMGYRKLIVKPYIVFYSTDDQSKIVDIVRTLYARRNWLPLL